MLLGKNACKAIAATFLLVMVTNLLAPTITYALTSGPSQPEASNFEPIDTSDMVNLQTGDMTYNIPLLEVPGPEGGYPMALAYHAGRQTGEDASWVGLGWSLSPGAITRDVNGYPDDYSQIQMTRRDYWSGGQTSTYQIGVNVGLVGTPASVSVGLSFSSDTYKGFGVGVDAGIGASYGPVGIQATVGINPYGGAYASISPMIGVGIPIGSGLGLSAVGALNISTNFKSVDAGLSAGGGLSYSQAMDGYDKPLTQSLIGASISSSSTKPSFSVGGLVSGVSNSNAGKIQTSSSGFGLTIPVTPYLGISLGYKKIRYWSDETLSVATNGVLFMSYTTSSTAPYGAAFATSAYDTYSLPDNLYYNINSYPDPRWALGGTFPDNDYYNVTAQGLGGNIRPYAFQEEVYMQNDAMDANNLLFQNALPTSQVYQNPQGIGYRFVNDFSNRYTQNSQDFTMYADPGGTGNILKPAFDAAKVYGNSDGTFGYDQYRQRLAGSKHIDYEYNINLLPGSSSTFTKPVAPGFTRRGSTNGGTQLENSFNYQIGGYRITNESGVTYHYMLPAYTGSSYTYTRANGNDGTFNMQTGSASYAYAWYLTGVTGPDYVDANHNNIIDEGDWGYWVSFEYGKWCDGYVWRNPDSGFQSDVDNSFETQSAGVKEVYYLNKVKTATHSAIFVKSPRNDGKGISSVTTNSTYGNYPLFNGGFDATSRTSMKLDKVIIMNNADADALATTNGSLSNHYMQNVFDASDIPYSVTGKTIRSIKFAYDYSLCPNTANSFDYSNVSLLSGKLTLNAVSLYGKQEASSTPPIKFTYDLSSTDIKQSTVTTAGSSGAYTLNFTGGAVFSQGDLVKFINSGVTYYCSITAVNGSSYNVNYLNASIPASSLSVTASTTKNPPYNKDFFDLWNMYKSDFNSALMANGVNEARATTLTSSKGKDAWSLRSITSSLGTVINMAYESDSYNNSVLDQGYKVQMYYSPNAGYYYNSNTDNLFYYALRNPQIVDGPNIKVGDIYDAVVQWTQYASPPTCYVEANFVIDTKQTAGAYIQVADLSLFNTQGIIGFHFINVLSQYVNSFPLGTTCVYPPKIANIKGISLSKNLYGGNLRVKSIGVTNSTTGVIQSTSYDYTIPATPSITSGITSFEPTVFDYANFTWQGAIQGDAASQLAYKNALYYENSQLLPLTREVPPPGVMYQYVSISNTVKNPDEANTRLVEGKTTYEFAVFNANMVGINEVSKTGPTNYPGYPAGDTYNTLEKRQIELKKYITSIGNVKHITRFDDKGNKLSETINSYLDDGLQNNTFSAFYSSYQASLAQAKYNNQGVIEENFVNSRYIKLNNTTDLGHRKAVSVVREEFPSIMTGQTVTDYSTGVTTSSENIGFDFYSGALTKKVDIDAYGNRIFSETVPAYRQYPTMGLVINTSGNKNMLTQVAESRMWKVDATNTHLGLVAANVTTWGDALSVQDINENTIVQNNASTNGDVWRSQYTYDWLPTTQTSDGLTAPANFVDFNWATPSSSNSNWNKTSEITRYNTYSKSIEAKDINGNYAASKTGYNGTRIVLRGNPANYNEIAYSGAEDAGINQATNNFYVHAQDGTVSSATAHTGTKSLLLDVGGKKGFEYTVPTSSLVVGRTYVASVWVKPVSGTVSDVKLYYDINGTIKSQSVSSGTNAKMGANGWILIYLTINGTDIQGGTTLNIYARNDNTTLQAYVDDFRFQPSNAQTMAYVYDQFSGELTHMLDNNNLYTRFEYDPSGRLINKYKEKLGTGEYKTNSFQYNYSATSYPNAAIINQSFTKNDCTVSGSTGSTVTENVPTGMFNSYISVADANLQATNYAQNDANVHGTCICTAAFTYAGVTNTMNSLTVSGTKVSLNLAFTYPSGATTFNLGSIAGNCALPTAIRTVPYYSGASLFNILVYPGGVVKLNLISGPTPSGSVSFVFSYDVNLDAFYSASESGTYTKSCTPPQVGSNVVYTVQQYKYSSTVDQPSANQLAINDVTANGQNYANTNGTCSTPCAFTWYSAITNHMTNTITSSGSTGNFVLQFYAPTTSYSGGTVGTITGGCAPSVRRTFNVTDGNTSSRIWNVTILPSGVVSISLYSGAAASSSGLPILLSGSYAL